jgi:clan AA aspartic protease
MGHVYQRVKLSAVGEEELTLMVDTGATYSLVSPALADRLGVARLPGRLPVTLADGREIQAELGQVRVEIEGRMGATTAIIAECSEPLLGVEALEVLGLAVDPTTGTLVPTRSWTARLGGVIASSAVSA